MCLLDFLIVYELSDPTSSMQRRLALWAHCICRVSIVQCTNHKSNGKKMLHFAKYAQFSNMARFLPVLLTEPAWHGNQNVFVFVCTWDCLQTLSTLNQTLGRSQCMQTFHHFKWSLHNIRDTCLRWSVADRELNKRPICFIFLKYFINVPRFSSKYRHFKRPHATLKCMSQSVLVSDNMKLQWVFFLIDW